MAVTTFEKGLRQGERRLLEARFGPLTTKVREHLDTLSPERLEALALELLEAQSLKKLRLED